MSDDEVKKIQADMEKQGFPLEIKTSEILDAHGWEVTNQASYLDSESGKNRTIDIVAERNVILNSKWGFDVWICIECKKKSDKPMGLLYDRFGFKQGRIATKSNFQRAQTSLSCDAHSSRGVSY